MQVGQQVTVNGNGITSECIVQAVGFSGYRSAYLQVKHSNGKIYFVEIKNCKATA